MTRNIKHSLNYEEEKNHLKKFTGPHDKKKIKNTQPQNNEGGPQMTLVSQNFSSSN